MSDQNKNIEQLTLDEILLASKPEATESYRAEIKSKLKDLKTTDEVLSGAIKFLEDHHYDFNALHDFLNTPANFSDSLKKQPSINFKFKYIIGLAAIFILAIGFSLFYYIKVIPKTIITESVFYEPGLPVFASISGSKEFHELMSAYRLQDANTGLTYFHKLILQQPMNDTLNYFGGWLYYQNNKMDSAVLTFRKVEEMKSSDYLYKATYMKAVCLYLNGNKAESKAAFELIHQNTSGEYYINSDKVLADKRLW